jgi:hypothetical protein
MDYNSNPDDLFGYGRGLNQIATIWWFRSTLTISGLRPKRRSQE